MPHVALFKSQFSNLSLLIVFKKAVSASNEVQKLFIRNEIIFTTENYYLV